jgi:RNA ligase (TIGR02306 family)
MRTLASIQKIGKLKPIPGAATIEKATVLGWSVVVKRGEFKIGDLCVYVEIDSILPNKPEFYFLEKNKFRIKTIRLRGQVSQGICFPLSILPAGKYSEGQDATEMLEIIKYEPPIPAHLAGKAKGPFPSFIPKTDEVRIQSCPQILERYQRMEFYATEKIDGTSMTTFVENGELNICSRKLCLVKNPGNTFWQVAEKLNLEGKLKATGEKYALQGELVGEGIQKNTLKIKGQKYFIFNVYDFAAGRFLDWEETKKIVSGWDLEMVPVVTESYFLPKSIDDIVAFATRKSLINPDSWVEGAVFRSKTETYDEDLGRLSFKVVNPEFLLTYE